MKDKSRKLAREIFWGEHDKSEYQCPDCGREQSEITTTFEVHHLDGNPLNNSLDNIIGLCPLCHKLREGKRPSRYEMEVYEKNVEDLGTNGIVKRVQEIGLQEKSVDTERENKGGSGYTCPECSGDLEKQVEFEHRSQAYQCKECAKTVHQLVAENAGDLEAVAATNGPLAKAARVALENGGLTTDKHSLNGEQKTAGDTNV